MGGRTPLLLLVFLLACCSGQFQQQVSFGGGGGGRVKVTVYFSTLCSDSVRFFRNQLYPAWTALQDIIDLEFVPYGKARGTPTGTGDYTFTCQHGPDECRGNKVMSCAKSSLSVATQVDLFRCMMAAPSPPDAGQKCSEQLGIDWAPIRECSRSTMGSGLLYKNGVRTAALKPRVYFIPTITINRKYTDNSLRSSLMSLESQICLAYQGPPHQRCF